MKKALKLSVILLMMLSLASCDWFDDDEDDVEATAGSGGEIYVAEAAAEPQAQVAAAGETIEPAAWYRGRTNPNRPTWYYAKSMRSYPGTLWLTIPGCTTDLQVSNNGHRWESNGYLVKQSDVSGRGMVVLAPASCGSRESYVRY